MDAMKSQTLPAGRTGFGHACREAVERILRRKPATKDLQVGSLAIDRTGSVGARAIQNGFSYAICDAAKQDTLLPGTSTC